MALAALSRKAPLLATVLAAALAAGVSTPSDANLAPRPEHEVKAAFLFNFAKFVDWPAAESEDAKPFRVCLLGDGVFGIELEKTLAGKTLHDRPVRVERVTAPEPAKGCQILFISSSQEKSLPTILASLKGSPTLTVGEMDRFADRGGMIGFVMENKRVRFDINQGSAQASGLKISSELLKLAKSVKDAPAP